MPDKDKYEDEVIKSYEKDEWLSVQKSKQEIKKYQELAKKQMSNKAEPGNRLD